MVPKLAADLAHLLPLLQQTLSIAADYLNQLDTLPPATDFMPVTPRALPQEGLGTAAALELFVQEYGRFIPASNGPRFWGFVTGGTTPAALAGDWLVSAYDLNLSAAANSVAPNIELEALHLLRDLFGLPHTFSGVFVTGATMANVVGLAIGREWVAQQHNRSVAAAGLQAIPPFPIFSGEAHSSIGKSLSVLGLGRGSLYPVTTLPGTREAVDVAALRKELDALGGAPCIVVANAGTVNTVDFDDIAGVAALKGEYPFWLHVDAAFGGFAACSPRYRHLLTGIELADSVTIDAHKWLNVPYDAAMLFTRHRKLQINVFQNNAAYLGDMVEPVDFVHLAPENSRRLRALPVWLTLLAYGRSGYRAIVEQNCDLAQQFGNLISQSAAFTLLAPVRLNVVCFTLSQGDPEDVRAFLARLRDDGRVFLTPTTFQGGPAMRAAFSNWRTQPADLVTAWEAMQACL